MDLPAMTSRAGSVARALDKGVVKLRAIPFAAAAENQSRPVKASRGSSPEAQRQSAVTTDALMTRAPTR